MKCKCNNCEMVNVHDIYWWCPHMHLLYTLELQLEWQKINKLPAFLCKVVKENE